MAVNRLSALCDQTAMTGIDFIQVVEPFVQTVLRVFFVVEPSALDVPMVNAALLVAPAPADAAGPLLPELALPVSISSSETGAVIAIASLGWRLVRGPAGLRETLEITVSAPGDFSIHQLRIDHPAIDPFFNNRAFSFKQGCPSLFDCRDDCTPEAPDHVDFQIDYLARDFHSLRRALLDFAAARYPMWSEKIEADQGVMLMEIMAALGDEFAYTQDRIAQELTLETATQRRSRSALTRLVDYFPDPGNAATTELAVFVRVGAGGAVAEPGARVFAMVEGRRPIPYAVQQPVWHHEAWNAIPLHQPDADIACLPVGSKEAFLATQAPTIAQLPPGEPLTPDQFLIGRRMILRSAPADPAEPVLAHAVTITGVSHLVDQLIETNGAPTDLLVLRWAEPLPFALPIAGSQALMNIVTVAAGEELVEHFRTGSDAALLARNPGLTPVEQQAMLALPKAIEREGVLEPESATHGRTLRYGLLASEIRGLGWLGSRDPLGIGTASDQRPLVTLTEVTVPGLVPVIGGTWNYARDLLGQDLDSQAFTLEEGVWRTIVTHQLPFGTFTFGDYASNAGWSIRFGDGNFGRPPEDGAVLAVRYHTAEGSAANLPPDSVTHLEPPPGTVPGPLLGYAALATNPLPITSGRDEEAVDDIAINAPEAWRALPLRAVRPEDYGSIIARIDWVQRASAVTAWTGSWSADFVSADPLGGVGYTISERDELEHVTDCIRLATRDARVADPDYLDIDLAVDICVAANAYTGQVVPGVIAALARPGLFDPDHFTFGTSLRRSVIEAVVQGVPGVRGVDEIRLRVRRKREWRVFDQAELAVGPRQIIRLQNDPLFPARGSLSVTGHGGVA
jgi:hypothetical protein